MRINIALEWLQWNFVESKECPPKQFIFSDYVIYNVYQKLCPRIFSMVYFEKLLQNLVGTKIQPL